MYYCENCYLLNEDDVCAFCGSRLTRGPKADDTGEVGTRTDFFVPYRELDHARQLEQVLMDSSFEQPED